MTTYVIPYVTKLLQAIETINAEMKSFQFLNGLDESQGAQMS